MSVHWDDPATTRLLLEAIAYDPSYWKIERLEERVILDPFEAPKS
jgi:hypothetical protein